MVQPLTTPRWEWRIFDPPVSAQARIVELARRLPTSRETSFLRLSSDVDVRVGDNGLEVQLCQRVDARGAEEWVPVLHTDFPLSVSTMRHLFLAWHRRAPSNLLPYYDEAMFRAAFAADPDVLAIDVTKKRWLAVIEGCRIELAELTVRGERLVTLAVWSEDRETLWRAIAALGLQARQPVSYVRGLRRNILAVPA